MTRRLPSYLAIDLGASSGRAVVGTLDGDVMRTTEVHRFRTPICEREGHVYWDVDVMWEEIRVAVASALLSCQSLRAISVDSWAVDYVPLDTDGRALRHPYSYRDQRTVGRMEQAAALAGGADALYARTGIQFLPFNTLPQVLTDVEEEPILVRATATRLLIAEYFLYLLSGRQVAEATMASTTQLVDAHTATWSAELLAAIGDDPSRWPEIVPCGTVLGPLLANVVALDGREPPLIVATCAHDTAAAVAAVPAEPGSSWAFISSGTWSLVGAERNHSILTREAREAGYTNEAGLDNTVRFLTNRAGMWVLEECRREWEESGAECSHETLLRLATTAPPALDTIDLNAPRFAPRGGMVERLTAACREAGVHEPESVGETVRLIIESLAASNAAAIDQLDAVTGARTDVVHVVGGGALNDFLNQLTADRCGRRVLAGPEEATVLGNLLVQARALGDLPAGTTIRDAARSSSRVREFIPQRGAVRADARAPRKPTLGISI